MNWAFRFFGGQSEGLKSHEQARFSYRRREKFCCNLSKRLQRRNMRRTARQEPSGSALFRLRASILSPGFSRKSEALFLL